MLWVHENGHHSDRSLGREKSSTGASLLRNRSWRSAGAPKIHGIGESQDFAQVGATMSDAARPFQELIRILWRRRRLIFTAAAAGTALAAVIGLALPPKYTATAQLIVELPKRVVVEAGSGVSPMDEAIDTHVSLLSSRDNLRRVIDSFSPQPNVARTDNATIDVVTHPGTNGDAQLPATLSAIEADEPKGAGLGQFWNNLGIWIRALHIGGANSIIPSLDDVEHSVRVNQERRSRVISVEFTSSSPKKAAAFANRIVQHYVADLVKRKRASSSDEIARLNKQLEEAKSETDRTRAAVQNAIEMRMGSGSPAKADGRVSDGQLNELERKASIGAQLYSNLLRRQKEIRDQNDAATPGVEIYALAEAPNRPSSHNPLFFVVPAFFVFVTGAGWLAVALEQRDRGLRSEQDIVDTLGIPCVGLVPRISDESAAAPDQLLLTSPFTPYSESIRSVITALQLAPSTEALNKVFLVGSSVPGEGKTTFALSLAACLALLGRRVLLVDFDFRKKSPRHGLAGRGEPSTQDPQLRGRLAEHVRHIPELGIDHLSMIQHGRDPLMLLASGHAGQVVRQLRDNYECVIIDGPPLLGTAEARLLPSIVDRVLFIVKWGSTNRELALNALNQLYSLGSFGKKLTPPVAIVTQVDLKQHAQYGYGDAGEYFANYAKHYSAGSETERHDRSVATVTVSAEHPRRIEGAAR